MVKHLACACAVVALAAAVSGCSSGSGDAGHPDAVVTIGLTVITRAEVNHWMNVLLGSGYYAASHGQKAPVGLVSDPADYGRCKGAVEAAATANNRPRPPAATTLEVCKALYRGVKEQAVGFLVETEWLIDLATEIGTFITTGEVREELSYANGGPSSSSYQRYLASSGYSEADAWYVASLGVYRWKLAERYKSGGQQELDQAGQRTSSDTTCQPGYVVPHCKEYKPGRASSAGPSTGALVAQIVALAG